MISWVYRIYMFWKSGIFGCNVIIRSKFICDLKVCTKNKEYPYILLYQMLYLLKVPCDFYRL